MPCCPCCCAQYDGECCGAPGSKICCKDPDVCCGTGESQVCCEHPRECCTIYEIGVGESESCCTETQYCCNDGQGVCCEVGEICCVGDEGAVCCESNVVCCAGVCCAEGECCVNDECTACESCSSVISVGSTLSLDCDCYVYAWGEWHGDDECPIPAGWELDPTWTGSPSRVRTPLNELVPKICQPGFPAFDAAMAGAQATRLALSEYTCVDSSTGLPYAPSPVGGFGGLLRHCCEGYCQDGPCDESPP